MKRILPVFISLIMICILASCQSDSVNTYSNRNKSMTPTIVANKKVITDNYLADRLQVLDTYKSFTNDELLKVQVSMKNMRTGWFSSDNPYAVLYRFTWFNKDGMKVDIPDESRWRQSKIMPGDEVWINSVAPDKECKDFVLRIKALN
jgi:uncharacterized protein YcfL